MARWSIVPDRVAERFRALAVGLDPAVCWPWPLAPGSHGYGSVSWREDGVKQTTVAHRVSFLVFVGPIPAGYEIDHECHNVAALAGLCDGRRGSCTHRPCWNPAHLAAKTSAENGPTSRRNRDTCRAGLHPWPASARRNGTKPNGMIHWTCGACLDTCPSRSDSRPADPTTTRAAVAR